MYLLENDFLRVEFINESAQIKSAVNKETGLEYIFDGIHGWSQQNPILFPMITNTYDKTQLINGNVYHMTNHGIARHAQFNCIKQEDNCIVFQLKETPESLQLYPFKFTLNVTYSLDKNNIKISYEIINNDDIDMPFQFGLHPAFNCPLETQSSYSDGKIVFDNKEKQKSLIGVFSIDGDTINLNREIFVTTPTILFKDLNSKHVSLVSGNHGVTVDISDFDYCAFWTPNDSNFICIEPWLGHGDLQDLGQQEFSTREGTMILSSKENKTINVSYKLF